jgi:predicted nucleotidyltransferase/HEPN domain-containing protein
MKTDLAHLPRKKQRELQYILDVLFEEFGDKTMNVTQDWKRKSVIQSVILFGSYARGDWVEDRTGARGYKSDYDLLIIVSHEKLKEFTELWYAVEERFFRDKHIITPVSFIIHSLSEVNNNLALGRYFFVDIRKQGIALYQKKNLKLIDPKPLSPEDALEMAKEYSEFWMDNSKTFLKFARFGITEGDLNIAAFNLHQATESAYGCILLTLTNYCPNTHSLKALRGFCESMDDRLIDVWPRNTKADQKPFNKLVDSYVKSRYSKHYKISLDMLDDLIKNIEQLHEITIKICEERVARLVKNVTEKQ